tara:strand:+ start:436 stop:759 length:324 start_codon:yes stop_codon:yes gene_type:complete
MSINDRIIESLLFASPEPLTQKKLSHIFDRDVPDLKLSVERLNSFYNKNNQSIEIINVAGGYQLRTKQEFSIFIKKLFKNNFKIQYHKLHWKVCQLLRTNSQSVNLQ